MLFQKRLLSVFLTVFGAVALQAQEPDCDDYGRTELMNYVIWQEVDIAVIKADVSRLWDVCYELVKVYIGNTAGIPITGKLQHTQYVTVAKRRASCMDSDIQALKNREQDLAQCIEKTELGINALIEAGAQLDACDNDNKTVLNYCQSYWIYEALRAHGVPFQHSVCFYFHPEYYLVGALSGVAILATCALYLYQEGYLSYDACMQEKSTGSQDILSSMVDVVMVPTITEVTQDMTAQDAFDIIELMGLSC